MGSESRPLVGIRRLSSGKSPAEQTEPMNCKSCRAKKIKCNRLKPSCNACLSFQSPCVYDAIPKKRGPKTSLPTEQSTKHEVEDANMVQDAAEEKTSPQSQKQRPMKLRRRNTDRSVAESSCPSPEEQAAFHDLDCPDEIHEFVHLFFKHVNRRPFILLHESSFRRRLSEDSCPLHQLYALAALSVRFTDISTRLAREKCRHFYAKSRALLDADEPSLDTLQTLLMLSAANLSLGNEKKFYMLLGSAIRMAFALDLHKECINSSKITVEEREARRQCFWTCYILDRFSSCVSGRPCMIVDDKIQLGLNSHLDDAPTGFSNPLKCSSIKTIITPTFLLVDIVRIMGKINEKLQECSTGTSSSSPQPWSSNSHLFKLRKELDNWSATSQTLLSEPFAKSDPAIFLAKAIYHLNHCLLYRPYLPLDLRRLEGSNQHQSWQFDATNNCFSHANAIGDLIQQNRISGEIEWSSILVYCISTAATVHTHGVFYKYNPINVFSSSRGYLYAEVSALKELRHLWAPAEAEYVVLQKLYRAHEKLVEDLENSRGSAKVGENNSFFARYKNWELSDGALREVPEDFVFEGVPFENELIADAKTTTIEPIIPQTETDERFFSFMDGVDKELAMNGPRGTPGQNGTAFGGLENTTGQVGNWDLSRQELSSSPQHATFTQQISPHPSLSCTASPSTARSNSPSSTTAPFEPAFNFSGDFQQNFGKEHGTGANGLDDQHGHARQDQQPAIKFDEQVGLPFAFEGMAGLEGMDAGWDFSAWEM